MKNWKICVVTSSRADYGLLYWTLQRLKEEPFFELQIVATGSHLSAEFGLTRKHILEDGFQIDREVEILLSSDTQVGVAKAMGLACIGFADVFSALKPDIVLVLGDRFEILAVAQAAFILNIPLAHCHGGELTEGAIDDAFRHSITKMAQVHFASTDVYRKRIIQLGEDPARVFNVGALGIENIRNSKLLDRDEFQSSVGFKLQKQNLIITYHPATLANDFVDNDLRGLFDALSMLENTGFIFTMPNADSDGRQVWEAIGDFVSNHPDNAVRFKNLGHNRYLSALKFADAVVGNSSSGIIEAPSFHIGTVNIGPRQDGRAKPASVIDCGTSKEDIFGAIKLALSDSFRNSLRNLSNPYDNGYSSSKIINILKTQMSHGFTPKKFYDVKFDL